MNLDDPGSQMTWDDPDRRAILRTDGFGEDFLREFSVQNKAIPFGFLSFTMVFHSVKYLMLGSNAMIFPVLVLTTLNLRNRLIRTHR